MRPQRSPLLPFEPATARHWFMSVVSGGALLVGACTTESERFEPAPLTCGGEPCADLSGSGSGVSGAGTSGSSTPVGGQATGVDSGAMVPGSDGEVAQFAVEGVFSLDLSVRQPLETGSVQEYPALMDPVSFSDGRAAVRLSEDSRGVWVFPSSDANLRQTLNVHDFGLAPLGSALAVDEGTLFDLTDSLALDTRALDAEEAAAFVFFTNRAGTPLTGVSVLQQPLGVTVAYDLGIIYSDAIEATTERGVAVLLHLTPTVSVPETQSFVMRATVAGVESELTIPAARGALTFISVVLNDSSP